MKPRLCHASFAAFLLINSLASGLGAALFWLLFGEVARYVAGGWTFTVFFIAFLVGAETPDDASS